jgi:hypothetical protein
MEVVSARCCGLDVHKKSVVACRIVPGPDGRPAKAIRSFGTMTDDLLALADWRTAAQVTHVAMESTGVFWQPIWNLLEGSFALLLVTAQHITAVPGRKTDVPVGEWIAGLLRQGLLRASFVPDRAQRELRELTRYRTRLVRERSTEVNRLQKTLEGANVKLAAVATDTMGHHGAVRAADPGRPGRGQRRPGRPGPVRQGPGAGADSGPGASAGTHRSCTQSGQHHRAQDGSRPITASWSRSRWRTSTPSTRPSSG